MTKKIIRNKKNITNKKPVTNKKMYGGFKTKEEYIKFTNKIVMTLFRREKNIFYFLEFIKYQIYSNVEKELNDTIAINDLLNIFSNVIEIINSKLLDIENNQDNNIIQNQNADSNAAPPASAPPASAPPTPAQPTPAQPVVINGQQESGEKIKNKHNKIGGFMKGGGFFGDVFELYTTFLFDDQDNEDDEDDEQEYKVKDDATKGETTIDNDIESKLDVVSAQIVVDEKKQAQESFNSSIVDGSTITPSGTEPSVEPIASPIIPDLANNEENKDSSKSYEEFWEERFSQLALEGTQSVFIFITEIIKMYTFKKIQVLKSQDLNLLQRASNKFASFFFDIVKNVSETPTFDSTNVSNIPIKGMEPSKLFNELITQEDITNYNMLNHLQTDLVELNITFKRCLYTKLNNINDKSILILISNKFYKHFHEDLKKYIIKYHSKYTTFISNIFLNAKNGEGKTIDSIVNFRKMSNFIKDTVITLLSNKEVTETLIKTFGTALDANSILSLTTYVLSIMNGNLLEAFAPLSISTIGIATTTLTTSLSNSSDATKILIQNLLKYQNIDLQNAGYDLTKDADIKKELTVNTLDSIISVLKYPVTFSLNKVTNFLNASSNFLYKNAEYTESLLEKYENSRQLIELSDSVLTSFNNVTFKIINSNYSKDELWQLLEAKSNEYKNLPAIQEKIQTKYTEIFFDYRKVIVDINSAICKVRCFQTFLPETILESNISNENNELSNVSYYDLQEEEYLFMFSFVSKKYENIAETIILLQKLFKDITRAYNIKYEIEFLSDFINSEVIKVLESLTPTASYTSIERGPTGIRRIGMFGGKRELPESHKDYILSLIRTIILCDFKIKYGINQQTEIERTNTENTQDNALKKLKELSKVLHTSINEINGKELLEIIQDKNYDKLLTNMNDIYTSKIKTIYQSPGNQDNAFLITIFNSINELRIKFSFELFSVFLNSDEYKKFKNEEASNIWDLIRAENDIEPDFGEIITATTTNIGYKGLSMFKNVWYKIKSTIAKPIGYVARATGVQQGIENLTEFNKKIKEPVVAPAVKTGIFGLWGGKTRKIQKKLKKSKKTKKIKKIRK